MASDRRTGCEEMSSATDDFVELMDFWAARETMVFGRGSQGDAPNLSITPREIDFDFSGFAVEVSDVGDAVVQDGLPRARIVVLLQSILSQHDAICDLPGALTLFDALSVKCPQVLESLSEFVLVVAIASITLRVGLAVPIDDVQEECLAEMLAGGGESNMTAEMIASAEQALFCGLDGRVWLPSPLSWSCVIRDHLQSLGAPQKALTAAAPSVDAWATLFSRSVPARSNLPPRALGFAACLLGFVNTGTIGLSDFRPLDIPEEIWNSGALVQMANFQVADALQGQQGTVSVDLLSQAMGCNIAHLRQSAFVLSNRLDGVLLWGPRD